MPAELAYAVGSVTWRAEVERSADGFRVTLHAGDKKRYAGTFQTGAACAKFVRDMGVQRFGLDVDPTVDTLDSIIGVHAKSVIPLCFMGKGEGGRGKRACPKCPYVTECGEVAAPEVPETEKQEDDSAFLQRLHKKVAKAFGGGK
jgi:hypothetical protein